MTVELRPLGVLCNLQCRYCYQEPMRDAGNVRRDYDLAAMKAAVVAEGGPFIMFGGEPLLMPIADLEDMFRWGLEEYGENGIQTNAALVTDAHIELFRRYRVKVGVSMDGPGALNDVRWHGTLQRTREATVRSQAAIEAMCRAGMPPGLIVTLYRGNATADRLPVLIAWFRMLAGLGITSVRLHLLESESAAIRARHALTTDENVAALRALRRMDGKGGLRFDVFREMRQLLLGLDARTSCVWNACDPYTTRAVRGVEGRGQRSNCGRTNKDGIDFVKADRPGYERYLALYHTPQDAGGCRDCRFFLMCKGQCPGTAIDNDWRNRSEHCGVWMAMFEEIEAELVAAGMEPVSRHDDRIALERRALRIWAQGGSVSMTALAPEPDPGGWRTLLRDWAAEAVVTG